MGEDVVQLRVLGHLASVKWRVLAVLAVVGALVGLGASLLLSPGYVSSSKVLLQDPRDEQAILTEAQLAVSLVVLDRTASGLGLNATGADLLDRVSAEVADGNIVRVTGRGGSPEEAQQLTQRATEEYVGFSTEVASDFVTAADDVRRAHREEVQQRIDEANVRISSLQQDANAPGTDGVQAQAAIESLRTTIADAQRELDDIDALIGGAAAASEIARASINIIEPAALPTGQTAPTPLHFAVGGALLFTLAGLLALLAARQKDPRLRRPSDIGAALGTAVVCTVDVPDSGLVEPSGGAEPRPRSGTIVDRILREDPQVVALRAMPSGARDPVAPYRRALRKLHVAPGRPPRLLVLVADDDTVARQATAALVLAAAAQGAGAAVVTEDEPFAGLMSRAEGPDAGRVAVSDSFARPPGPDLALFRVVGMTGERPALPEDDFTSEVVVVLTAGTRTGWELVAIAEACTEAGRRIGGAVVVAPSAGGSEHPPAPQATAVPDSRLNGHAMAVSE